MKSFLKVVLMGIGLSAIPQASVSPLVVFEWEMDWPVIGEFCEFECNPGPGNEPPAYVVGETGWCCAIWPD